MVKAIIIGLVAAAVLGGGAYLVFHKNSPSKASQTTVSPAKSAKPANTPATTSPSTAAPSAPANSSGSSSQPSNNTPAPAYNY